MNYQTLKTVSQSGTYVGIFLSSVLSWLNFGFKTTHEPESGLRKAITPVGRLYGGLLLASFAVTFISAIMQNIADSHLRQQAEERGSEQVKTALENQHTRYISDLTDRFEGKNGVIPRINAETQQLKEAESHIVGESTKIARIANKSLAEVTGNGQFCYLMAIPVGKKDANGVTQVELGKMNSGPLPLDVCHVIVREDIPIKSVQDAQRAMSAIADKQLGPLPPGKIKGHSGTQGFGSNIVVPVGSYYIQINTRNDYFYETLKMHPLIPGKGWETIEVRDKDGKVVFHEP